MQLVNDQVGGWAQRVVAKIQEQLQGLNIQTEDRPIVDVLREISGLAKGQLVHIKQRQEHEEEDSVANADFMGDFASEEYVTKNIRVMPTGGSTFDNQSEHTSRFAPAAGMGASGIDSDVEDAKHNNDAQNRLVEQRAIVKAQKAEADRRQ